MANLAPADANRPPARHQHAVTCEQHLVLIVQAPGEKLQQAPLRKHLRDLAADAVGRQHEQPASLVVGQSDRAVSIGGDRAFVDSLKARLAFFEKAGDLVRLEAKGLALEARRQQHRSPHAQTKSEQQRHSEPGQLGEQLVEDGGFEEADRDHADHVALVKDGRFASRGDAQRAALNAHPRVAGQDRRRVLVNGLADHGRVRM